MSIPNDILPPRNEAEAALVASHLNISVPPASDADEGIPAGCVRGAFFASLIRAICIQKPRQKGVVTIKSAKVLGAVVLDSETLTIPLSFEDCKFNELIDLRDARTKLLKFLRCEIHQFKANRAFISSSLVFSNCRINAGVRLHGTKVLGNLEFQLSTLKCEQLGDPSREYALGAGGAKVGGSFVLRGDKFKEESQSSENAPIKVNRTLLEGVNVCGIQVTRDWICENIEVRAAAYRMDRNQGHFFSTSGMLAIDADRAQVGGNLKFGPNAVTKGEFRIRNAVVGGNITFDGAELRAPAWNALSGDGLIAKGQVTFRYCGHHGSNVKKAHLQSEYLTDGIIRLVYADIKEGLYFDQVAFRDPPRDRPSLPVHNNINPFFFTENDEVRSDKRPTNAERSRTVFNGLDLRHASIIGKIKWKEVLVGELTRINFTDLTADVLSISWSKRSKLPDFDPLVSSWPTGQNIDLEGFRYKSIEDLEVRIGNRTNAESYMAWLLRVTDEFRRQPFSQMAKVFQEHGLKNYATEILIRREEIAAQKDVPPADPSLMLQLFKVHKWQWLRGIFHFIYGITVSYGYRPGKIWIPLAVCAMTSLFVFHNAFSNGHFIRVKTLEASAQQKDTTGYPEFNSLAYTIESLVPFVNLQQNSFYLPTLKSASGVSCKVSEIYSTPNCRNKFTAYAAVMLTWLNPLLGWILVSILASAMIDKFVRRD